MAKQPVRVLVTGAAGQIGYALVPMIARGVMLGPDQPVILHMLDIPPAAEALNCVVKELIDAASPLVDGVVMRSIPEACTGVKIAILIGSFTSKSKVEGDDEINDFDKAVVLALGRHAAANCKILVAANPGNITALLFKNHARSIPEKNITFLMRHDHNRALGQISQRLHVRSSDVKNVIIWGNHSSTLYPDINHAMFNTPYGEYPVREWVDEEDFITCIRKTRVISRRGRTRARPCATSVSIAICDHIRDWIFGTPEGNWVSMGVFSDGSYEVPSGVVHSFPVTCQNGEWTIVPGLQNDAFLQKMDLATKASIACHIQSFKILYM